MGFQAGVGQRRIQEDNMDDLTEADKQRHMIGWTVTS